MKENKIKVVVKEVNKPCEVREITNDYKAFQGIVEGLYEITQMPNREDIDIACNEEYLLNGMDANLVVPEHENVLGGPLIFMGYDPENGDSISLTDEQIVAVQEFVQTHEVRYQSIAEAYYGMKAMLRQQKTSETEAE